MKPRNPKSFAKQKYVRKSYDYRDLAVSVDAKDQQAAEQSASHTWQNYLEECYRDLPVGESRAVSLGKCSLNLTKKAEGLFNGFASDEHGQVIEKFDDQTVAMVAKNLELKSLVQSNPTPANHPDAAEDRQIAREEAVAAVSGAHDRIDQLAQQMEESTKRKTLRIRFGDFELELKKSVHDFVSNYKKSVEVDKQSIAKAVRSWRRNMSKSMHFSSDYEAAKELVDNWDMHKEGFNQILFATQQLSK